MAKKYSRTPEELQKEKEKMLERELRFAPEPTYFHSIGDRVIVGALKNCVVEKILFDGKAYIVSYDPVNNVKPLQAPSEESRPMKMFPWFSVRHLDKTDETHFRANEEIRIDFSNQTISSLIHKVLYFGVNFDPVYQRSLVWSEQDREKLLDSIFSNIDIGKFVFVEDDFVDEDTPIYEILDGKQRLSAIVDFYLDRYPYHGKYYSDLSGKDQSWFESRVVAVAEPRNLTETEKLKYFIMLNTTGHVVEKKHLNRIRSMLKLREALEAREDSTDKTD